MYLSKTLRSQRKLILKGMSRQSSSTRVVTDSRPPAQHFFGLREIPEALSLLPVTLGVISVDLKDL